MSDNTDNDDDGNRNTASHTTTTNPNINIDSNSTKLSSTFNKHYTIVSSIIRPMMVKRITEKIKRKFSDITTAISSSSGQHHKQQEEDDTKTIKKQTEIHAKLCKIGIKKLVLQAEVNVGHMNLVRVTLGEALNVAGVAAGVSKSIVYTDISPPPPPYLHPYDNTQLTTAYHSALDQTLATQKSLNPQTQLADRKRRKLLGAYRLAGVSTFIYRSERDEAFAVRIDVAFKGVYVERFHVFFELVHSTTSTTYTSSNDDNEENNDNEVMFRMSQHTLPNSINVKSITERNLGPVGLHLVDDFDDDVMTSLLVNFRTCIGELFDAAQAYVIRVYSGKKVEVSEDKLMRNVDRDGRDGEREESIQVVHSEAWDLVSFRIPSLKAGVYLELQLAYDDEICAAPSRCKCKWVGEDVEGGSVGGKVREEVVKEVEGFLRSVTLDEAVKVLRKFVRGIGWGEK